MAATQIKLDKRFKSQIKGTLEKYEFSVGMADAQHYAAKRGARGLKGSDVITSYASGPARKVDRSKPDGKMIDIAHSLQAFLGRNFWTEPFQKTSSDIVRFTNEFFKYAFGKSEKRRLENLLQAIVRNPFLRGDYGSNSKLTQAIKGFDRLGIDTAQFFKNIVADVRKKRVA